MSQTTPPQLLGLALLALPAVCLAAEAQNPVAWFLFFFVMVGIPALVFFAVAAAVFVPLLRRGVLRLRAVAIALPLLVAAVALGFVLFFWDFRSGGAVIVLGTIVGIGAPALLYAALVLRFGTSRR